MKARVKIDLERKIGLINRNIYGHFMSRRPGCSEGGLYEPTSPTADEFGLRRNVVQYIADLRPPIMRWPGGCTGTSYHWLDGVGPVAERPHKIDLHFGWEARYEFGTDEFLAFCQRIGAAPQLNLATGTATLEEGAAWLEYCNSRFNTYYANLRRKNGHAEPYNVKYWQIGNEMYGPWEVGHCQPEEYAAQAREFAKVLRRLDPSISILAVGGNEEFSPEWVQVLVPEVGPYVDYITFHTYWRDCPEDPWSTMLAGPHRAEAAMEYMAAVIRLENLRRRHQRTLSIAVTEWNATPEGGMMGHHPIYKPFGPTYTLRDALAVATFINIMQRHCREITLANVAQSINVVGLIMVNKEDVWREPVYWPLYMQVHHSGPIALDALVECETFDEASAPPARSPVWRPEYRPLSGLSYLDCSVTLDRERRKLYLSLVNRHRHDALQVNVDMPETHVRSQGSVHELYHSDPMAMNTPANPDNVRAASRAADGFASSFVWELKPHSYTILELDLTG